MSSGGSPAAKRAPPASQTVVRRVQPPPEATTEGGGTDNVPMKALFKTKPKTPADLVRHARDLLLLVDRGVPDTKESKVIKDLHFFFLAGIDLTWIWSTAFS